MADCTKGDMFIRKWRRIAAALSMEMMMMLGMMDMEGRLLRRRLTYRETAANTWGRICCLAREERKEGELMHSYFFPKSSDWLKQGLEAFGKVHSVEKETVFACPVCPLCPGKKRLNDVTYLAHHYEHKMFENNLFQKKILLSQKENKCQICLVCLALCFTSFLLNFCRGDSVAE